MELLLLISALFVAYGIFVIVGYLLAKVFFPAIQTGEEELKRKRTSDERAKHFAH